MSFVVTGNVSPCCQNNSTGVIILNNFLGGIPPYTYQWSNGATTKDISDLMPGLYWVRATDSHGNTDQKAFYVNSSQLSVDFIVQTPSSGQNNGSIKAIVTGNLTPIFYLWNTGATTQQIDNIGSGTYVVTVIETGETTICALTAIITIVDQNQNVINMLRCCSGDLAYNYVWAIGNGLNDMADCALNNLILLQGYLKDICNYVEGACITADQYNSLIEKAKTICGFGCGEVYTDSLKQ